MVKQRIDHLRKLMETQKIDAFYIPTADFHESEYVGDYFKAREYMTGFTGSAGVAVITLKKAGLWTDGRYFVQAENQLKDTGVSLFRMGQPKTPSVEAFLAEQIPEGGTLGFDGRVVNAEIADKFRQSLKDKKITIKLEQDLIDQVWVGRPQLPANEVWILKECYAGRSAGEKLENLRCQIKQLGASIHLLTNLDDIMWLLNIRGNDIPCNPVALSYLAVNEQSAYLFVQKKAVSMEAAHYLKENGVEVKEYDQIYEWVRDLENERILLEKSRINEAIYSTVHKNNRIIDKMNPSSVAKAVKNEVEVENMRNAHIKDGVAVTKFIYWLKNNIGKEVISEISAADQLEKFRRQQKGYLEPSFDTISAYGEHGAIVHYKATEESNKQLEASGLYLVDSGGQYYEGTTDITRTVVLGALSEEQQMHMTLAAISMLRLGHAKFLSGASGVSLDYIAREPLWSRGLNYDHGTGHGVGYLLNVHERPNGIRYRMVPERMDYEVLKPGMITSDEPGIYVAGSHGVRIENLILCKAAEQNQYGQFLEFEFLTYVPIDLDGMDISLMEKKDIEYLNQYHREVYDKISPYLTEPERKWLYFYTRPI